MKYTTFHNHANTITKHVLQETRSESEHILNVVSNSEANIMQALHISQNLQENQEKIAPLQQYLSNLITTDTIQEVMEMMKNMQRELSFLKSKNNGNMTTYNEEFVSKKKSKKARPCLDVVLYMTS